MLWILILSLFLVPVYFRNQLHILILRRLIKNKNMSIGIDVWTGEDQALLPEINQVVKNLIKSGITVYPLHPIAASNWRGEWNIWRENISLINGKRVNLVVSADSRVWQSVNNRSHVSCKFDCEIAYYNGAEIFKDYSHKNTIVYGKSTFFKRKLISKITILLLKAIYKVSINPNPEQPRWIKDYHKVWRYGDWNPQPLTGSDIAVIYPFQEYTQVDAGVEGFADEWFYKANLKSTPGEYEVLDGLSNSMGWNDNLRDCFIRCLNNKIIKHNLIAQLEPLFDINQNSTNPEVKHSKELTIISESLPERCSICHKSDCFDKVSNSCSRCKNVMLAMPTSYKVVIKQCEFVTK